MPIAELQVSRVMGEAQSYECWLKQRKGGGWEKRQGRTEVFSSSLLVAVPTGGIAPECIPEFD